MFAGVANVITYMAARMRSFGITPEDRVLQWSAMHFDMCVLDFWCPVLMGCAAVTATMEDAKSAARVAVLIQKHRVAIMDTVPSMCQVQPAMHHVCLSHPDCRLPQMMFGYWCQLTLTVAPN